MFGLYAHAHYNLKSRVSLIDTPQHAFVPQACVDHTHPYAVIAVAVSANAERLTREIFGDDLAYTPWLRPGFEIAEDLIGRLTRAVMP
jgi:rhamnose utilization protein RhaD (predicted bifunctional aldolase and dehydrogenase)